MKRLILLLVCIAARIAGLAQTEKSEIPAVIKTHPKEIQMDSTTIPPAMNHKSSIDDYEFKVPEKWQMQKNKEFLSFQNMESGCQIKVLSPQPSSGDLEKDTKAVFDMMYAGWQFQKTGGKQYILSNGYLPKGLEYCMMEAPMTMTGADGRYYLEDGAALIVKMSNEVVIISVRHTNLLAHSDCLRKYETWRRFFNSFTVRNIPVRTNNEAGVTQRIIGAWSQSESGASSEYIFAANGNYAYTGAIGTSYTSRDYNYEYLHIKNHAFDGDGSYAISGDQLTLIRRGAPDPEQARFRFEKVNHGGMGWKDRLYLLTKNRFGLNEVCYEKHDNQ